MAQIGSKGQGQRVSMKVGVPRHRTLSRQTCHACEKALETTVRQAGKRESQQASALPLD